MFYHRKKTITPHQLAIPIAIFAFIAFLIFTSSCSREEVSTSNSEEENQTLKSNPEEFFSNYSIGYIDDDELFVSITPEYYQNWITYWSELDNQANFEFLELSLEDYDTTAVLKSLISYDNDISISHTLVLTDIGDETYLMTKETCECENSNCTFGCEASSSGPGHCNCSGCSPKSGSSDDCTKTHTISHGGPEPDSFW